MPLVPYHSNTFEELFRSPDQKTELKLQYGKKTLTLYSEEDCRNIRQYTDATHIFITDKFNHIGGYLFAGFSQLRQVSIPNSVTFIKEKAFSHCESLTDVFLPDSIEWIGFLKANRKDHNVLRLLCFCADGDTLFELYDAFRTELADVGKYTRLSRLSALYDAFCLNESHEAQKIREWLAKDIEQAQDDSFEEVPTDGAPAPSEEPWDDADRWRMLNELEEVGYDEPQNESACDNEGWGELFCGTEGDPFAAFGGFADFDENTEDLLDQLDEEEWDEYEDDYDEDWDEYESDCIGDYEAGDDVD